MLQRLPAGGSMGGGGESTGGAGGGDGRKWGEHGEHRARLSGSSCALARAVLVWLLGTVSLQKGARPTFLPFSPSPTDLPPHLGSCLLGPQVCAAAPQLDVTLPVLSLLRPLGTHLQHQQQREVGSWLCAPAHVLALWACPGLTCPHSREV